MTTPVAEPAAKPSRIGSFLADSWLAIVFVVLAVIFILSNQQEASLKLLWFTFEASIWLVFAVVFVAGGLTGWIMARRRAKKRSRG